MQRLSGGGACGRAVTLDFYDHDCRRCTLSALPRATRMTVCVPGTGPVPCDVVLVGEAPGADEEREGQPFIGAAGRLLNDALARAGIDRRSVFIDNTCRCRPPNNRAPKKDEVAACMIFTAHMLEAVRPKVIIALGGAALKALTGIEKIGVSRGKVLKLKPEYRYECAVIAAYHPASAFRSGSQERVITDLVSDFKFAQRLLGDRPSGSEHIITGLDVDAAKEAMRTLATADWLSCDAEWTVVRDRVSIAKWPWTRTVETHEAPELVALGIAGRVNGTLVAVSVPAHDADLMRGMRRILARVPTVYHQSVADLVWLFANGFEVKLGGDTLVLGAMLNLETSLSLEAMASLLTDVRPDWKRDAGVEIVNGRKKVEAGALLGRMPLDADEWRTLLEYNARDCIATHKLNVRLNEIAAEKERVQGMNLYEHVLLPATEALAYASLNGAPIDMDLLASSRERARVRIHTLVQEVADKLGVGGDAEAVVLNDRRFGAELARQGVHLPMTAKLGIPQVTRDTLLPYKGKHPAIAPALALRETRKLHGTYIDPWYVGIMANGDAALHSIYKPTGARTGRTSAESDRRDEKQRGKGGAHMQNYPHNMAMRRLVRAPEGQKIIVGDESQIELRVAAWLANERTMLRFMRERIDMHTALAAWLLALRDGETIERFKQPDVLASYMARVTPDERYHAKPGNFGLLYGGSEDILITIARKDYGITLTPAQAALMRAGFFLLYSDLPAWHEAQWAAVQRGYCVSPFGRWRYTSPNENPNGNHRKMINTPVQNTANDLAQAASRKVMWGLKQRELWQRGAWYIGYVHDSIMYRAVDEHVPLVASLVKDALEAPDIAALGIELPFPLVGDVEIGQSWGEMEPFAKVVS